MRLKLVRFHHGKNDTLGILYVNGDFQCFTLEDEFRAEKVAGETRIPEGTYWVELRNYGTHAKKYGHPMLEIKDVPGFTDILIHKGNTERDTAGCVLVGRTAGFNYAGGAYLGESTIAYDSLYAIVADAVKSGVVTIEISFLPIT